MNVGDKDTSVGVFVTSHLRSVLLQAAMEGGVEDVGTSAGLRR
jgi:hypothetical protein